MTSKIDLFYVHIRINEIWRFKAHKVEKVDEEYRLSFFNASLWQLRFSGCGKESYHFQQELMMSKMVRSYISF